MRSARTQALPNHSADVAAALFQEVREVVTAGADRPCR
jgi:hypothetical protein